MPASCVMAARCRSRTYNAGVSPTRRRRTGDPSLDDAAAGVAETVGTAFADLDETAPPPEEPAWLRETPGPGEDPAVPIPVADPAVLEARRRDRAEQIVRALNPEQARAVTTTEGPLLILAGAGSGKTRVLAHRIAYLVGVKGVAPWRILAVTFTNRAAQELRERIISLVGEGGRDVQAGTFHSLCARVLRADGDAIGVDRRFVIYDTDDQSALMKQILKEEDLPLTGEFRPSAVLGAISRAKNEMLDPSFLAEHAANHRERTIARLATRYQERLRTAHALDFDDLLLEAVRLFQEAPEVLAKYQEKWRYLHVDEYQDTNRAQYLWIRALAEQRTATSRSSATTTSRSTRGAAPTCATSSISSATGRPPRSSSSSRTTAPPSSSSTRRTRSSRATAPARTRSSGPRTRRAPRSSGSRPTTRRRRPSGSPARSRA